MKQIFKMLSKLITLAILMAIITPVLYFAWRMGKPLSQPEFNGLTYYQFVNWRVMECEKHQSLHPNVDCRSAFVKGDIVATTVPLGLVLIEHSTIRQPITVFNFLPVMWDTAEYLFWFRNFKTSLLQGFGDVPTPEQLEAMKNNHTANSTVSSVSP
jgi:hypothetical protein